MVLEGVVVWRVSGRGEVRWAGVGGGEMGGLCWKEVAGMWVCVGGEVGGTRSGGGGGEASGVLAYSVYKLLKHTSA